uniref:uncharacterized protein LOC120835569 n=1 Tax=Gasterosteus aculeatus aculeatus TaxID=481459 RepID=UPI001A984D58|nr:uncharacterized protein LOC120835569 [Gasterosteus aculeatus aculeatus]XP_040060538.1 uncharacterized protein LOC120835569 [Gasterosteus aculeatus aculeatus]
MAKDCLMKQYTNLGENSDRREKLICEEKEMLASLDKEKTLLESRIQETSAVPGGILQHQGDHKRDLKHINDLERKLHLETITFNKVMCRNTEYRKAVEHLLQMKDSLCKSESNRQLAHQKILSEKLEQDLALLFDRRLHVETRISELEEDLKVETAQFMTRRSALETLINAQLQKFLKTKLRKFPPLEKNEDSTKKKNKTPHLNGAENLEMYKQGYRTLVEVTGETELCQMGLVIAQKEQKNVTLTKYINELDNRKHMLTNKTEQLKSDILSLEEENRRHDDQIKKHLQPELEENSCQSEALEKQHAAVQKTLDQLAAAISDLLGDVMREVVVVNSDNIVHNIGILEERVGHLLLQANNASNERIMLLQNMLLANFDLLPGEEEVMETPRSRSASRSPKETR